MRETDQTTAELLECWPPLPEVEEAWRALAVERESVFATPDWFAASVAADPRERPMAVVCRRRGTVVGVVPLVCARRGPARVLRFAGTRAGDWFGPVCRPVDEPEVAAAAAQALDAARSRWHAIEIDRLDAVTSWADDVAHLWPGDRARLLETGAEAVYPYLDLPADGGYEAWLGTRRKKVRSELRRMMRRLLERREVRFRMTETEAELDCDIDLLFRLHAARWEGRSDALTAETEPFHRDLVRRTLRQGWLRLWLLEVEGEAVAADYGWRIGPRYLSYLGGHDPARRELAPGAMLLLHTIERAAAEGVTRFDLMRGDEDYKRRLETGRRYASSFVLTRRRHPLSVGFAVAHSSVRRARALPDEVRTPVRAAYRTMRRG